MLEFLVGRLDAGALTKAALRRSGRARYKDMSFYAPLEKLVSAYESEAELSLFGRFAARFDIQRCLTNLLNMDAAEEADPSIVQRPITAPLFITGLPRSSTTFLHTLLSQDPANAVPLCWQLIYPFAPRRPLFGVDRRRAIVEWQFRVFKLLSPGVSALHPLSADAPQECTDITAQVFQSLRFDTTHHIPSYQNWFDHYGQDNAFAFHRRFLQNLDAQNPGKHWVLKSPDHVFCLDAIGKIYPDARVVFLHRDPLSVVASCAKLTAELRKPFTRKMDPNTVGQNVAERLIAAAERMTTADGSILHLYFRDVIADPMAAVAAVYTHCGRTLSPEAKLEMEHWLAALPAAKKRRHYDLDEFGLEAAALRERFAGYMRRFDIPIERQAGEPV